MQGTDAEPAFGQLVGEPLRGPLRPGEDDRLGATLGLQQPADDLGLVQVVRLVNELVDLGHGDRGVLGLGADVDRLVQVHPGQPNHRRRHGGAEQQRLPGGRGLRDQPLDVGQEAHVEHLVGLVQHQHPDRGQVERAPGDQVEQPSGGAHHDVDAGAQRADLDVVADPAVDGQHPGLALRGGDLEIFGDLQGQLACRAHHERLRLALGPQLGVLGIGLHGDPLQQADAEGQRLSGAGAGLADHVGAVQRDRDRQGLDGEGVFDADGGEGVCDLGDHAQVGEGGLRVRDPKLLGSDVAQCGGLTCTGPAGRKMSPTPAAKRGRPVRGDALGCAFGLSLARMAHRAPNPTRRACSWPSSR